MKTTVKKKNNSVFLYVKSGHKERFDRRETEILSAGTVSMLLAPIESSESTMVYDVTPYTTLDVYLSCHISKERFAELLLRMIQVVHQMRKTYLNCKNLLLEPQKIFVLPVDRTIHFVYLPLPDSDCEISLDSFFKSVIGLANRTNSDQADYLNVCMQWLNRPFPFVLDEFEDFVRDLIRNKHGVVSSAVSYPGSLESAASRIRATSLPHELNDIRDELQKVSDYVINESENRRERKKQFFLTRQKTGERIKISAFPFLIGTEANSQYCITDNGTISRKHAVLREKNGKCTVSDQKSTNGTFVNGTCLLPYTESILHDGDTIQLAKEHFTFSEE